MPSGIARGIVLPHGDPSDPPGRETVCGLGNRKDGVFLMMSRPNDPVRSCSALLEAKSQVRLVAQIPVPPQ
jgi:hypothetical protein